MVSSILYKSFFFLPPTAFFFFSPVNSLYSVKNLALFCTVRNCVYLIREKTELLHVSSGISLLSATTFFKYLHGSFHSSAISQPLAYLEASYFSQPQSLEPLLSSFVHINAKKKASTIIIDYRTDDKYLSIQDKWWVGEKLRSMKLSSSGAQKRMMVGKRKWSRANELSFHSCHF